MVHSTIETVDIFLLKSAAVSLSKYPVTPVICRINTNAGITGFGEAGISVGLGEHAVFGMVQDMAHCLIGKDPMDNEVIWEEFHNRCYGHCSGGGVVVFSAMSAIDTALMDIKGKALGAPVYQLLGGKHNDRLHCYVSQAQLGWNGDYGPRGTAQEYADICKAVMRDGYDAVKLNLVAFDRDKAPIRKNRLTGPLKNDIYRLVDERLSAIREQCGDDLSIIMELFCATDVTSTVQLDQLMCKHHVLFAEEATTTFTPHLFKVICDRTRTPLATGERIHTRWGFSQFLAHNSLAIIQPDVSNCGGISEAKKICDTAHVYDVRVQMHVCGTPISDAAALQVEAAIPNFYIHEVLFNTPYAEIRAYCKNVYQPVNGYITVPDVPGIGQELSEKAIEEAVAHIVVR